MALICEFGTAPDQKAEGYGRMLGVVRGTEAQVARQYAFKDVRLVRGGAIIDQDGVYEFAVLVPEDGLILGNRITSPYAAMVNGEDTGLAGCSDVARCEMAHKCLRSDPRLAYKSGHKGHDAVCRFLIPVAQAQQCDKPS